MARKKNVALKAVANEPPAANPETSPDSGPPAPEVGMYGEDPFGDHYVVQIVLDDYVTIRYPKGETRSVDYDEWPGYAPHRDVDPQDYRDAFEQDDEGVPTEAPRPVCVDLDLEAIDEAIKSRVLDRIAAVLTDVERVHGELETELATVKADLGKRIKTVRARRADLIHEIEEVTHTWVVDRPNGIAYMVHADAAREAEAWVSALSCSITESSRAELQANLDRVAKRTRPLALEDSQEALPFAAEG